MFTLENRKSGITQKKWRCDLSKKVLVVEDNIGISRLLKIYLEKDFYKTDIVLNGRRGLYKALNQNYDLIILDILLPDMNGFQILKKIRELKSTPVIMLSAQDDKEVMKFSFESGANEYVLKPFNCKSVVNMVKKLIS